LPPTQLAACFRRFCDNYASHRFTVQVLIDGCETNSTPGSTNGQWQADRAHHQPAPQGKAADRGRDFGLRPSGKSTLARHLVSAIPGAHRLRGDDFLDSTRSDKRSSYWDGVERLRLVSEVLAPFREKRPSTFRRWDWAKGELSEPEKTPEADILIVDLIGLFHPDTAEAIDLAIWCDVDLETATARGTARDAALGRSFDHLWRDVWVPNERDFEVRFAPRSRADVLVPACGGRVVDGDEPDQLDCQTLSRSRASPSSAPGTSA
jgi:uridine kinase